MNPLNSTQLCELPYSERMKRKLLNHPCVILTLMLLITGIQGCSQKPSQTSETNQNEPKSNVLILTVSEPIKYMTQRITDDSWATVEFPANPSVADPAYWTPSADIVRRYQEADLVLLNGGGYAKWTAGASLKKSRLRDTSSAFKDRLILADDAVVHQHGPEGEHSHEGYATMTWLDFELAGLHADAILEALKKEWPGHGEAMEKNHISLKNDLKTLHENILELSQKIGRTPLLASHPVYHYLAKAYNLNIKSLHWEPDTTPSAAEWEALDKLLADNPVEWMIWEDTPTEETQSLLEQRNIKWLVFRPQGGPPKIGDFLAAMHQNVQALGKIAP